MSTDIYLQFSNPQIKGESQDQKYKDWIEITSWQASARQPKSATASTAGAHTAERVQLDDMVLMKHLDLASPLLFQNCAAGQTFKDVKAVFRRADASGIPVEYLKLSLKNVIISSISHELGSGSIPMESLTLAYAAVQYEYTQQSIEGGAKGTTLGAWDANKNTTSYPG